MTELNRQQAERAVRLGLVDSQTARRAYEDALQHGDDVAQVLASRGLIAEGAARVLRQSTASASAEEPGAQPSGILRSGGRLAAPSPGPQRFPSTQIPRVSQSPSQSAAPGLGSTRRSSLQDRLAAASQAYREVERSQPLFAPHAATQFELLGELGVGGMGAVHRVKDLRIGREAALKILRSDRADERSLKRFLREARVTAMLKHPAVPPVFEAGLDSNGRHYILMQVIEGETLGERIRDYHAAGRLEAELRGLIAALVTVGEAVSYAHSRGVLHRDIKPENIMLGEFGEVMLMDWGIAKRRGEEELPDEALMDDICQRSMEEVEAAGLTMVGAVVGTVGYMSPEQARGEAVDARADVFALGAVLTELLCGESPMPGDSHIERHIASIEGAIRSPRELLPGVPRELHAIARSATQAEPDERTACVAHFVGDLKAWLAGDPVLSCRYSLGDRLVRAVQHRPTAALGLLGTAVLVLLGLLLSGEIVRAQRGEEQAQAQMELEKRRAALRARKAIAAEQATKRLEDTLRRLADARALADRGAPLASLEAMIGEALRAGGRTEPLLLEAANILTSGGALEASEKLLSEAVKRFPPAFNALFELHELACRRRGGLFESRYLKALGEEAKRREIENEFTLIQEAIGALDGGQAKQAIELATKIEKYSSKFVWMYLIRGAAYTRLGKLDAALKDYDRAISIAPKMAIGYRRRAELRVAKQMLRRATADLERACALRPLDVELRLSRAKLYCMQGQGSAALEDLKVAIPDFRSRLKSAPARIRPLLGEALAFRARVYVSTGRVGEALRDFSSSLELRPNSNVFGNRGALLFQMQRFAESIRDFSAALKLAPNNLAVLRSRANTYTQIGRYREALADLNLLIATAPDAVTLSIRAVVYQRLGEPAKSRADFAEALRTGPNQASVYANRARVFLTGGQYAQALQDCDRAISLVPGDILSLILRVEVYAAWGKHDQAIEALGKAAVAVPGLRETPLFQITRKKVEGLRNAALEAEEELPGGE